jgi:putative acetyltransferase
MATNSWDMFFFRRLKSKGPRMLLRVLDSPPWRSVPTLIRPDAQGKGVGTALVRAALAECPRLGWKAVFLLGDPGYYSRFGFELSAPRGLHYESEAFDSAFQFLETTHGSLEGCRGWVRFNNAFDER